MTDRLLKAISNPNTSIIGHPTGRLQLRRDAYPFDMEAVLTAAAKHKVAMELNSYPDRLDLNDVHLRQAKQRGVKIVIINAKEDGREDPRAYVRGLGFSPIAVANGNDIAVAYGVQYIPGLMIVDGKGTVAYRRPWTDLPAGQTVAQLWDQQVRTALDALTRK